MLWIKTVSMYAKYREEERNLTCHIDYFETIYKLKKKYLTCQIFSLAVQSYLALYLIFKFNILLTFDTYIFHLYKITFLFLN